MFVLLILIWFKKRLVCMKYISVYQDSFCVVPYIRTHLFCCTIIVFCWCVNAGCRHGTLAGKYATNACASRTVLPILGLDFCNRKCRTMPHTHTHTLAIAHMQTHTHTYSYKVIFLSVCLYAPRRMGQKQLVRELGSVMVSACRAVLLTFMCVCVCLMPECAWIINI